MYRYRLDNIRVLSEIELPLESIQATTGPVVAVRQRGLEPLPGDEALTMRYGTVPGGQQVDISGVGRFQVIPPYEIVVDILSAEMVDRARDYIVYLLQQEPFQVR